VPDAVTGATTSTPATGITTTTPTTGFNSVTGASGVAKATKPGGDLDKDAFLKLLVAQLKYQNPMSPADPNEFLGQTAQFTMVEKLEEISKAQTDLTVWQKVTAGQSLVGRQVTGKGDLGTDLTGVVTGLTLGSNGPQLLLADGSKMAVNDVTQVSAPTSSPTSATTTRPATSPTTTPTTTPTTGASPTSSTDAGATTPTTSTPAAAPAQPATEATTTPATTSPAAGTSPAAAPATGTTPSDGVTEPDSSTPETGAAAGA
jgi:flagellar basal-body rod modification protein FlgD